MPRPAKHGWQPCIDRNAPGPAVALALRFQHHRRTSDCAPQPFQRIRILGKAERLVVFAPARIGRRHVRRAIQRRRNRAVDPVGDACGCGGERVHQRGQHQGNGAGLQHNRAERSRIYGLLAIIGWPFPQRHKRRRPGEAKQCPALHAKLEHRVHTPDVAFGNQHFAQEADAQRRAGPQRRQKRRRAWQWFAHTPLAEQHVEQRTNRHAQHWHKEPDRRQPARRRRQTDQQCCRTHQCQREQAGTALAAVHVQQRGQQEKQPQPIDLQELAGSGARPAPQFEAGVLGGEMLVEGPKQQARQHNQRGCPQRPLGQCAQQRHAGLPAPPEHQAQRQHAQRQIGWVIPGVCCSKCAACQGKRQQAQGKPPVEASSPLTVRLHQCQRKAQRQQRKRQRNHVGVQISKQEREEGELGDRAVVATTRFRDRHAHGAGRIPEGPLAAAPTRLLRGIAAFHAAFFRNAHVGRISRSRQKPDRLGQRPKRGHE